MNPIPHPLQALIFDLDGTLLDSFPAHFRAYLHMFARFGIQVTEESFYKVYSPNWLETYERIGLPRDLWEEADRVWMEEALKIQAGLFPEAVETLEQLRPHYRLGLVTSGSHERVLGDLRRTGIGGFFEVVITGGDVQRPKPDPQGLQLAMDALCLCPADVVYIGDAQADYEMALAAGVTFIGVPSRFASLLPETECERIERLRDLVEMLR